MRDLFERIIENKGPLGKWASQAEGYFVFPKLEGPISNRMKFQGKEVITWSINDYLGLANLPEIKKIDAPLLVGLKVLGPLSVFAGPSFQYILDTEFDGINIDTIENDFSVGLNFGIGVNFNKIGIDLRYERGFSENEATFIDDNLGTNAVVSRIDTRPDQLILSLSIAL